MRRAHPKVFSRKTALAGALSITLLTEAVFAMGRVDDPRLRRADLTPQNWYTLGRDQNQTYYSPLAEIDSSNADRLGFAWSYDLGTLRGQEATPIVVDGVMFTSGTWGYVYALDAATGKELWTFDPKADPRAARNPCCDLVNRGVAVWKGKVFVASVDGRLHALDARTGQELWQADTIIDHALPYSSTGAVYIAGDHAVIGNSGADMEEGGVRGYVSAYHVKTGELAWRFYTVPGAPGKPPEDEAMALAASTWNPARPAKFKGGGTVWDGFAYDAEARLLYFGTANPTPYDLRLLGDPPGDALFTASIVALDVDTGRLAWHYQTTPGDRWDFDAVQKLILADLEISGETVPVIMQANKNGFFYVLERRTGRFLSAQNFTYVNWAAEIDHTDGRPRLTEKGDWFLEPKMVYPSWAGGHSWPPMSFSPQTGLVYIPAIDAPSVWIDLSRKDAKVNAINGFFTTLGLFPDDTYDAQALKPYFGPMPERDGLEATRKVKLVRELIRAWDPRTQKLVWEHETSSGRRGYDGGVMSTGGNLVLQGRGNGELWVYAADTGKVLKKIETGSHMMAAPMTYSVNGTQYIAVQAGYGGTAMGVGSIPPTSAALKYENKNRILAFKLDGGEVPKPPARKIKPFPEPPIRHSSAAEIEAGEIRFIEQCSRCHTLAPNITPDLRKMPPEVHDLFNDIVLRGAFSARGMASFSDILDENDAETIHAYLIDQSWQAFRQQEANKAGHQP